MGLDWVGLEARASRMYDELSAESARLERVPPPHDEHWFDAYRATVSAEAAALALMALLHAEASIDSRRSLQNGKRCR